MDFCLQPGHPNYVCPVDLLNRSHPISTRPLVSLPQIHRSTGRRDVEVIVWQPPEPTAL